MIFLKSENEIQIMRRAGAIVADVLLYLADYVKPQVTTLELNALAHEFILKRGALPTFIGYNGYKHALCTSVNEQIVHGIPGNYKLKDGDIIGIDCGVTFQGFVADHAKTFLVGQVKQDTQKLVQVTQQALEAGISACTTQNRLGDIGYSVESLAVPHGYGIVRDYVGHGVGRKMHEEPQVPNFGKTGTGIRLKAGMVLAIEPMFNKGAAATKVEKDGWTVVTKDGSISAHFEHTVAITNNSFIVLTLP